MTSASQAYPATGESMPSVQAKRSRFSFGLPSLGGFESSLLGAMRCRCPRRQESGIWRMSLSASEVAELFVKPLPSVLVNHRCRQDLFQISASTASEQSWPVLPASCG
jgi:hypothetical protein